MLKKILQESFALVAGKPAEELVSFLDSKNYVNEFLIAKKLGLTINQTRNVLYRISDHGIVSSIRKKDKRKGWYTYFWKIENLKSLEFLKSDLSKKAENLTNQIRSKETKRFYACERCHLELNEENALLNNFTCTECGDVLTLKDNIKNVGEMKRNLDKIKKEIVLIDEEIAKENEVVNKKRMKEIKKEQAEKIELLKKKKKLRDKEKKKLHKGKVKHVKPQKKGNKPFKKHRPKKKR